MSDVKQPNPPPYSTHVPNEPRVAYNQPNPADPSQPRTIVIANTPGVIIVNNLGPNPTACHCYTCNQQIVTYTKKETSTRTHLLAGLLCLIGCWLCVWIPYCADACKRTHHYCPQCNTYLGSNSDI